MVFHQAGMKADGMPPGSTSRHSNRCDRHRARCMPGAAGVLPPCTIGNARSRTARIRRCGRSTTADGNPFDDFVEIAALASVEKPVVAVRLTGAADIEPHIGVTLLDIPAQRADLVPQEHACLRHIVVVVAIRGCGEQTWKRPSAVGPVDPNRNTHTVTHRDPDIAVDTHGLEHRFLGWRPSRRRGDSRPADPLLGDWRTGGLG